jgi:hypothetical protein
MPRTRYTSTLTKPNDKTGYFNEHHIIQKLPFNDRSGKDDMDTILTGVDFGGGLGGPTIQYSSIAK